MATIVWFRNDLRLRDNPALTYAASLREPIIPLYILDEKTAGKWTMGGAQRWWLERSLVALEKSFKEKGLQFIFRKGDPYSVLSDLIKNCDVNAICWNRLYEPYHIKRDQQIYQSIQSEFDVEVQSFNGSLLIEPWEIKPKTSTYYKVFTPFWKNATKVIEWDEPMPVPDMKPFQWPIDSDELDDWELGREASDRQDKFRSFWQPGETGGHMRLDSFIREGFRHYANRRDFPAEPSTSRLSPHLHFGEISPREVAWYLKERVDQDPSLTSAYEKFISEIGWREFSYHLLFHYPKLPTSPFNDRFSHFPWEGKRDHLRAWQRGLTGYPLVDAGMRELWATGFMHNRVRMVVASFLTKDLFIDWREGEKWFWETLVDADLASNSASWQWVAGCGADAAPYFRIFNPVKQSEDFDPDGTYIRKWVPQLQNLPKQYIHAPWNAPQPILYNAGVQLGDNYPYPIIDHAEARKQALAYYENIKEKNVASHSDAE
jgi:deoxyribodipyrimidine photo-lyase